MILMTMVMVISTRQRGELEGWLYFEDIKEGTHLRGSQVSKHLLLLVFQIWEAKSRILKRTWIIMATFLRELKIFPTEDFAKNNSP